MPILLRPMPVLFTATCRIVDARYRVVQSQFDLDPRYGAFGEYVLTNLMRERGDLQDGGRYHLSISPLFKR